MSNNKGVATAKRSPVVKSAVVVPVATLKRWRRNAWELTSYCSLQATEGWYAKDCIERGVAKRRRCRVCKLLGEIDDSIARADTPESKEGA